MPPPEPPARLAGVHPPDRPGLPRGRSRLPGEVVRRAQRERLARGVIAAVAEKGFARTTVTDVVKRARVSRDVFYAHFGGLGDCFLGATAAATRLVNERLFTASEEIREAHEAAGRPWDAAASLRAAVRAYLALCAQEPEYTRCLAFELPAAGPEGLRMDAENARGFAALLRLWHERAAAAAPGLAPADEEVCLAAVGAVAALVRSHLAAGTTALLPAREDAVLTILLRLLAAPAP
ncbi:TetR family transcriptional regulator [Streptomyces sp. DSM 44917]|uniref:TetR family transcriptional regulator n=1 Tax=Streptomyces boetiae TaxID=3075541 RepID=A0ABU2LES2_9ACTN|nr:TetR family transcriptional regulator [Streptomyces sp. DSM 44917]MDT0310070.1 TetR family transcriptional regulator [Streptomyces sp. DSM 44917]